MLPGEFILDPGSPHLAHTQAPFRIVQQGVQLPGKILGIVGPGVK
jgi:hypothetical protein